MVLYLDRMCQCGLLVVVSSLIGTLMNRLAVELRLSFRSVSLWNDLASAAFDGVGLAGFKSRANVFFYWPELLYPYYSLLLFSLSLQKSELKLLFLDVFSPILECKSEYFNNNHNNNRLVHFKKNQS